MKKAVNGLMSAIVIFTCVVVCKSQVRPDMTEARERQRQRQAAVENPANNPFKIEPYEPLTSGKPVSPSVLRATVELQVVSATDGDTLIIGNTAGQPVRLRLQGIDAPEQGQAFFKDATDNLLKLAAGKTVTVEFDPRGKPDDRGRIIAKVYLDGDDLAYAQLKNGFAWYSKTYKKLMSESDRYTYAEAEKEARGAARGLWRDPAPLPPWSFRK